MRLGRELLNLPYFGWGLSASGVGLIGPQPHPRPACRPAGDLRADLRIREELLHDGMVDLEVAITRQQSHAHQPVTACAEGA